MLPRTPLALTLALAVVVASGCGGAPSAADEGPRAVMRAYGDALARGDVATTLALERESAHRDRDGDEARARVADASSELAELGRALASAPEAAVRSQARVPLASGEVVVLARDPDGGWRIDGGILGMPALREPRDAIAALHGALARRHLRGIEEVLARRTRAAWEAEIARVIEQTEDVDALLVDVDGERATVRTPDGVVIELVREADEWRVLDVRPAPPAASQ